MSKRKKKYNRSVKNNQKHIKKNNRMQLIKLKNKLKKKCKKNSKKIRIIY